MNAITKLTLAALSITAAASAARAADPDHPFLSRIYAGVTVAALDFDDAYKGVHFSDSSTGAGIYAGFRLKDHLALELSYDSFDAYAKSLAGTGAASTTSSTTTSGVSSTTAGAISKP